MLIATIVGARPQFIKAAVVSRAIARHNAESGETVIDERLVHTGQHFDENMSDVFFREMCIPQPSHHLGIGGGTHGQMTGRMIEGIERVLLDIRPNWVLVYGDTNSTLAGTLAAVKLHIPVAHVEAGLRSFNRRMPEEINRVMTDHASTLLFAPTDTAVHNLQDEGIANEKIARVGDVMFDAMIFYREQARGRSTILRDLGVDGQPFVLTTVHRAENTDDIERLRAIVDGLITLADDVRVVLPVHPRTRKALANAGVLDHASTHLCVIDPIGYLDMVMLESAAALIATDSGGVQKEAYFNGVPCLTLRDQTEWTELIDAGAAVLVGADREAIVREGRRVIGRKVAAGDLYGDGRSAKAIVQCLLDRATTTAHASSAMAPLAQ